jgi:hypothetical protein
MALPYRPLRVDRILPPIPLRDEAGASVSLPLWRLNLLLCKGDKLFLASPNDLPALLEFTVERGRSAGPITLRVSGTYELCSHANNVALLEHSSGSTYLLATGGNPAEPGFNGTLTILPLSPRGQGGSAPVSVTHALPRTKSTWGLDAVDGADLIAVSSNSYTTSVYKLAHGKRDGGADSPAELELEPLHCFRSSHFDNIPCVCFGPQPAEAGGRRLLYSASIDCSFCVYQMSSGRRLLQDGSHRVDNSNARSPSVRNWCWSVAAVSRCPPKLVAKHDALFGSFERIDPRKAFWVNKQSLRAARESGTAEEAPPASAPKRRRLSLPVYDDGHSEDESLREGDGARDEPSVTAWQAGPTWDAGVALPRIILETPGSTVEEQFLVVGRQETIHLYRLSGRRNRPDMAAEELQRVRPAFNVASAVEGAGSVRRIVQILQLPRLSALIVVQQGGAVSVVRLVSIPGGERKEQLLMVVEGQLDVEWNPISGVCVSERRCVESSYEVWVAQVGRDGRATIACFELCRPETRFDAVAM